MVRAGRPRNSPPQEPKTSKRQELLSLHRAEQSTAWELRNELKVRPFPGCSQGSPATIGHRSCKLSSGNVGFREEGSPGSPQGQEVLLVCKELGHGAGARIREFVVEETAGFQERWKQSTGPVSPQTGESSSLPRSHPAYPRSHTWPTPSPTHSCLSGPAQSDSR